MTSVTGNQPQQPRSNLDVTSGPTSSRAGRANAGQNEPESKRDVWTENIHMRQSSDEDPSIIERLAQHRKMLSDSDKYIDFVHHVEKANQAKY
jgi:hypothetical protein